MKSICTLSDIIVGLFLLLFYYWQLVSASKGHHQANIYKKKLKMLLHYFKHNWVPSTKKKISLVFLINFM